MEFTKLAQLTQDTRYYDAVARITDELHAWQNNTKIPGLWPTFVDTSGCRKSELGSDPMLQHSLSHGPHSHVGDSLAVGATSSNPTDPVIPNSPATPQPGTIAEAVYASPSPQPSPAVPVTNAEAASLSKARRDAAGEVELNAHLKRRQLAIDTLEKPAPPAEAPAVTPKQPDQAQGANAIPKPLPLLPKLQQTISKVNCEAQGIGSPPGEQREHFSLGAMADSTYEYLPKQFLLLGGQVSQYKTMYERAIAAASKYLLFRPMVPGSEDILVMGQATTSGNPDVPGNLRLDPQQEHLLCFTGGMYALGSKIFNRPEDLSIAAKLTNGCVWGYKSTATGIMPESFQLLPCESLTGCEWNKTAYYEALDPYQATREETQIQAQKWQEERKAQAKKVAAQAAEAALASQQEAQQSTPSPVAVAGETVHTEGPLAKRQLGNVDNVLPASELQVSVPPGGTATSAGGGSILDGVPDKITYPSHEEFVEDRIANERIPPGFTQINSKKYILR
jgi:mannosyl-oligosaccharide alpha-1,2-mannosidase